MVGFGFGRQNESGPKSLSYNYFLSHTGRAWISLIFHYFNNDIVFKNIYIHMILYTRVWILGLSWRSGSSVSRSLLILCCQDQSSLNFTLLYLDICHRSFNLIDKFEILSGQLLCNIIDIYFICCQYFRVIVVYFNLEFGNILFFFMSRYVTMSQ